MSDGISQRLYYTDAYRTEFESRVLERAGDGRRVYLEQTAFYPTSGGQPNDVGTLGGIAVTDVVDEGDRIAHVLVSPLGAEDRVAGRVDWTRRFDHMQQHTGQHLVSAVLEELYGHRTISVHFGADYSTLDLDAESVTREALVRAEDRANRIVLENRPVSVTFEDAAAAAGLRKPSDREGTLRVVSIEGVDRSACGGTHVRTTGEIGPVLLRRCEKIRKATRVEFVCGMRALRRARADYEALSRIAASLSASLDDAAGLVAAQAEQLREAENVRRRMERELAGFRAKSLYDATLPDAAGRRIAIVRDAGSMEALRSMAQAYCTMPGAILLGAVADPPAVLFGAAEDTGIDAGRTLREIVGRFGGRGGGSPRVAQGSAAAEAIEPMLADLRTRASVS
ncbi:MAG TPA: alanyl-tRNA editing protein [Gemmatimonadaceae bacterium]|nr:alanyl-tRNA editing protein [Gemmatimonadaceae bacterium]